MFNLRNKARGLFGANRATANHPRPSAGRVWVMVGAELLPMISAEELAERQRRRTGTGQ